MIEEHTKQILNEKIGLNIINGPDSEYLVLPVNNIEVDCVEVGHHHGGVDDVVEEDDHRQDHVGKLNISENKKIFEGM